MFYENLNKVNDIFYKDFMKSLNKLKDTQIIFTNANSDTSTPLLIN